MNPRRPLIAAALALTAFTVGAPAAVAEPPESPPATSAPTASAPAVRPPTVSPPTVSPPAASAPAVSAPAGEGAAVRINDRRVFNVIVGRAGATAAQRAAAAGQVLERAVDEAQPVEVRVVEEGDVAVIYADATPVIQLGVEDAAAAGDASLSVHAANVAAKTRVALDAERKRSAIAKSVFSFSLVVFSGLVAFLLLGKLVELVERVRAWLGENPDRLPVLRVRGIEVVRPAAVRGSLSVALSVAKLLAQVGIVYAWLLFTLSLFEATHDYTERLTGFVVTPLSALVARIAVALPVLVIAGVTALAVGVALRFVGLFFGSVTRGETTLVGLPRELAPATSLLVRFGIVVVTLMIAAPLITGTDDGALSRAGMVALCTIGAASAPILGTAAAGIAVMFNRRLRVGECAVVGGRRGRVLATTLLEVVLEEDDGSTAYIPHLASLWHPTRIIGPAPLVTVEITLAASADLPVALEIMEKAAAGVGVRPRVELSALDAAGARFRIQVHTSALGAGNRLVCAIAAALAERGLALGKSLGGGAA